MTLNEAIFNVITTMRKKDMIPGAMDAIKKAGFDVNYRGDGAYWRITSPKTHKIVYFRYSKSYYSRDYIVLNGDNVIINDLKNCKVDFVNYLNKPINSNYYSAISYRYQPTKEKYTLLKDARFWVKYESDSVERLKREIASKQKDLENAIRCCVNRENDLKNLRKKYNLSK